MTPEHAVLLAGGIGSRLRPLNSTGTPKALLPIGNEALISFPLRTLEEAGIKSCFVICYGDASATQVRKWIAETYRGRLELDVKSIKKDSTGTKTATALKVIADKLTGENVLVISGDLVTDLPLKMLLISHLQTAATCTSLLTQATGPLPETKPGKAPSHVDFVGLDEKRRQLLYFDSCNDIPKRSLRFGLSALQSTGAMSVQTDLVDQHCYVFNTQVVLDILESKPNIQSIKEDLVPYIVRHQHRRHIPDWTGRAGLSPDAATSSGERQSESSTTRSGWWVGAVVAPHSVYCKRTNTLAAYGDVNKEVTGSAELAARFLTQKVNSEGYFRPESVVVAPKTMVGAGCMLGPATRVGEKSTLKRSVIGARCSIGSHVKLLNSVVLDDVTIDDNCSIQNCILCSGSHVKEHAQLRDCQVGPQYVVASGSEHRGELFDTSKPPQPV